MREEGRFIANLTPSDVRLALKHHASNILSSGFLAQNPRSAAPGLACGGAACIARSARGSVLTTPSRQELLGHRRPATLLTWYYRVESDMEATTVTSKGQVTIPQALRQKLGIRQGSKVEFSLVGDHVEMRVVHTPASVPTSGFGMLKSKRAAVPADFDPASLVKP